MMKHVLTCAAAAALASCQTVAPVPFAPVAGRSCSTEDAKQQVAATIRAFFAALAVDDDAAVLRLTTPNFYAFEIGKRYTGAELSKVIANAHRSGRIIQWNIGTIDSRVDCNLAFAAWENAGAAGTAGKLKPRAWLESASLLRQGNGWAIDMLHSTPKDPLP